MILIVDVYDLIQIAGIVLPTLRTPQYCMSWFGFFHCNTFLGEGEDNTQRHTTIERARYTCIVLFVFPLHNFCLLPYSSRVNAYCAGIPSFLFTTKTLDWYTGTHRFLVVVMPSLITFIMCVNNEQRTTT